MTTDTNTLGVAPAYYAQTELTALPAHEMEIELSVDADGSVNLAARGTGATLAAAADVLEQLARGVVELVNPAARTARAFADTSRRFEDVGS